MKNVFIICGYGVSKDIFKDEKYNFYLNLVFNNIYDLVIGKGIKKPLVIASGGMTDCFRSYRRSEGKEIIKFLRKLSKRPFLKKVTRDWDFIAEKKSLSTLENIIDCQNILKKKKIKKANLYIFCEQTRARRVKYLTQKILNKGYKIEIIPVDFDISSNRYLDPKFINKKEAIETKHSLWALKNSENLKKHHQVFKERIGYLRKAGSKVHTEAIKKWWEGKLKELEE